MSPKPFGGGEGGTAPPVEPSPPSASRWPRANTRHPPANTHSAGTAGAGVDDATGVGLVLDRAMAVGAGPTAAGAGGKTRSHGLTTAAPRKIPTRKVRIGTARLTPLELTGSNRTSSRCSSIADLSGAAWRGSDLPEVGAPDVLVRGQGLRLVGQDHATGLQDVAAVSDVERLERVLLDQEDRGPLRVDRADDAEDLLDQDRAPGRATARRAGGPWAWSSGHARWRASAARRPTASRPSGRPAP